MFDRDPSPLPDPRSIDLDRLMQDLIGPDRASLLGQLVKSYHALCDRSPAAEWEDPYDAESREALSQLEVRFRTALRRASRHVEFIVELIPAHAPLTEPRVMREAEEIRHSYLAELRNDDGKWLLFARGALSVFENPVAMRVISLDEGKRNISEVLYSWPALEEEFQHIDRKGAWLLQDGDCSSHLLSRAWSMVERQLEKADLFNQDILDVQVSLVENFGIINIETPAGWYAVTVTRDRECATVSLRCTPAATPQRAEQPPPDLQAARIAYAPAAPRLLASPVAVPSRASILGLTAKHQMLSLQCAETITEPTRKDEHDALNALREACEEYYLGRSTKDRPRPIFDRPLIGVSPDGRQCFWLVTFLDEKGHSMLVNLQGRTTLRRGPVAYHLACDLDDPQRFDSRLIYSRDAFFEEAELIGKRQLALLQHGNTLYSEMLDLAVTLAGHDEGLARKLSVEEIRALRLEARNPWPIIGIDTAMHSHHIRIQLDELTNTLQVIGPANGLHW